MFKLRLVFLGVASALVLGAGTALADLTASTSSTSGSTTVTADADAHGDAVANAEAKTASAEGQENRDGAREAAIDKCQALDKDTKEPKSSKGMTKAQKKLDHIEDKAEVKAFVACVTGHSSK